MQTFAPSSEETRIYECLVLVPLDLTEHTLKEELTAVEQLFSEKGGKLLFREDWGRQGLAYPIKRHREGRFVLFVYELPPNVVPSLDTALLLQKGVLRHLLVKTPKKYTLLSFAEHTEAWSKEREKLAQEEEATKEERLKQRIVRRATRALPPSMEVHPQEQIAGEKLEEELGKIISDEDLRL